MFRETVTALRRAFAPTLRWTAMAYGPMLTLELIQLLGVDLSSHPAAYVSQLVSWILPPVALLFLAAKCIYAYGQPRTDARHLTVVHSGLVFGTVLLLLSPMYIATAAICEFSYSVLCARADVIITATEKYVAQHGRPPSTLADLTPECLPAFPIGLPRIRVEGNSMGYPSSSSSWSLQMTMPRRFGVLFESCSVVHVRGDGSLLSTRTSRSYGRWAELANF